MFGRPPALALREQLVGPERARRDDDAAGGERPASLAQPTPPALGDDLVAVAPVAGAERPDVDDLALGEDLHAALLGEPEVVLRSVFFAPCGQPTMQRPQRVQPGAVRPLTAEVRVGDGLAAARRSRRRRASCA